jgi:cysteinyl-tRNA synthetase
MKIYNSLTKKKENFVPINSNEVKIYSCGPTIYNFVHIGNLRSYIFSDILVRSLKFLGYSVNQTMNLTDVDDKTIRDSKNLKGDFASNNERLLAFTKKYEEAFLEDLKSMNILIPKNMPKATESIFDMELIIQKLIDKKFAYLADDGIYFDVRKNLSYGKLVNIDFDNQKYNFENRVVSDEYEKDNVQDFALWKFKKESQEPAWEITIDNEKYLGRPGWHIECSAMANKIFGEQFDIHTGGVDLKFPHHENEIAQSSCALDNFKINYFMHNEHLLVDGTKMSKSKGNFYTLRDLIEKGYSPLAVRETFIRSHYRQKLNFTFKSLEAGIRNVERINNFVIKIENLKSSSDEDNVDFYEKYLDDFKSGLEDDLNLSKSIASVYEFMNDFNKLEKISNNDIDLAKKFMLETDRVLGLIEIKENIPVEIIEFAKLRKRAKDEKNWILADELRDKIKNLGYEVRDDKSLESGFILKKL